MRAYLRVMQPLFVGERPLGDIEQPFRLHSEFIPAGDQPQAIDELCDGLARGERDQVLLGVTGSGKTFTMAHVIARMGGRRSCWRRTRRWRRSSTGR